MRRSLYYLALPVLSLAACQSGTVHESGNVAAKDAAAVADSTNFTHDISALNSPSRKQVRTADVRCRVNNVFNAVTTLEHTVAGMDGVVVESTLQNTFGREQDIPWTNDSLQRVRLYTPTANLTLRVPASKLDSVVHVLTSMATFIDQRTLKEQDKTLAYLSIALKNQETGQADVKPDKKVSTLDVANYRDDKKESAIDRKIANMAILDESNYATFSVQLFQPQLADVQTIVNPDRVTRAGFGTEVLTSLRSGMVFFRDLLLFLLRLWPLWVLGGLAGFLYRKYRRVLLK